jgi:hypothetical protein
MIKDIKRNISFRFFKLMVIPACLLFSTAVSAKWSFGVHGDSQWTLDTDPTGQNPDYVSAAIVNALNKEFIAKGVKFVIQVGDLADRSGDPAKYSRAAAAKSLFDQGIGFFPLRGNHEELGNSFGLDPNHTLNLPAYFDAFPQTRGLTNQYGSTYGAYNFSSPAIAALNGLSYSFDYGTMDNNARFVVVDVEQTSVKVTSGVDPVYGQGYTYSSLYKFTVYKATQEWPGVTTTYDANGKAVATDVPITISTGMWFRIDSKSRKSTNFYAEDMVNPGQGAKDVYKPIETSAVPIQTKYDATGTEFFPGDQQSWISAQLDKATRGTKHAFVFSHRGLMGENHADCLFGSNPGSKETTQNPFYASLMNNGVKYMISGHDHMHNHAIVESPDGQSRVQQIISCGASSKFFAPASISSFNTTYGDVKKRETQISQELKNIGYYIYTIDGPRVTVDYYSDAVGDFGEEAYYPDGDPNATPPRLGTLTVPNFNFVKKDNWGYSLNGEEFIIAQGQTFAGIADTFQGVTITTIAKILGGVNNCTAIDGNTRPFKKVVNTGWTEESGKFRSNILTLWGMGYFGAPDSTDQFVLSMSYDPSTVGACALVSQKDDGTPWTNAVDLNKGGVKKFVAGPYKSSYGIGTYGIDFSTKTVWAVVNHASDFAVQASADGDQNGDHIVNDADVNIIMSYLNKPANVYLSADLDNDGKITILDVRKEILLKTN